MPTEIIRAASSRLAAAVVSDAGREWETLSRRCGAATWRASSSTHLPARRSRCRPTFA